MSYKKTTWINDSTPVNADNMNKIEDGIEAAHNDISNVRQELSELNGNTGASVEVLEAEVGALKEDTGELRAKIDLVPKGVISIADISQPELSAVQALKVTAEIFSDIDQNVVKSECNFLFRDRKTGDLYFGTIGDLMVYDSSNGRLKKVGNSSMDYDEKIESLQQKHEEYDGMFGEMTEKHEEYDGIFSELKTKDEATGEEISNLKERVEKIEEDMESPEPIAFVISEGRGLGAAIDIKYTFLNNSDLLPEGMDEMDAPVYLYDQTTKYLSITTQREEAFNFEKEVLGKVCFLGDIVTKEYVDDLFQSIIDGNEVAY